MPPLEQNILDLSQRQWIAEVHHHHEADYLGRAVEITEGIAHRRRLRILARRLKPIYSDNAVPRGAVHAFKNVGSEPARLRYTFTPAGDTEAMFRAFFDAAKTGELAPGRMAEIAAQYDQEFVGPTL